jgi:hypothetical protein
MSQQGFVGVGLVSWGWWLLPCVFVSGTWVLAHCPLVQMPSSSVPPATRKRSISSNWNVTAPGTHCLLSFEFVVLIVLQPGPFWSSVASCQEWKMLCVTVVFVVSWEEECDWLVECDYVSSACLVKRGDVLRGVHTWERCSQQPAPTFPPRSLTWCTRTGPSPLYDLTCSVSRTSAPWPRKFVCVCGGMVCVCVHFDVW